jgi:hypothetical protein
MLNVKIELKITGQLIGKGYLVYLEGQEIQLFEDPEHVYSRLYDSFPIDDSLDVNIQLRGMFSAPWTLELKINNVLKLQENGNFPRKGTVNISKPIKP